jgi:hypothetical protein
MGSLTIDSNSVEIITKNKKWVKQLTWSSQRAAQDN